MKEKINKPSEIRTWLRQVPFLDRACPARRRVSPPCNLAARCSPSRNPRGGCTRAPPSRTLVSRSCAGNVACRTSHPWKPNELTRFTESSAEQMCRTQHRGIEGCIDKLLLNRPSDSCPCDSCPVWQMLLYMSILNWHWSIIRPDFLCYYSKQGHHSMESLEA